MTRIARPRNVTRISRKQFTYKLSLYLTDQQNMCVVQKKILQVESRILLTSQKLLCQRPRLLFAKKVLCEIAKYFGDKLSDRERKQENYGSVSRLQDYAPAGQASSQNNHATVVQVEK